MAPIKSAKKAEPVFSTRFASALSHFGATLLETSGIAHSGIKGTKDAFRNFLEERLPRRYGVACGEVVDQHNSIGPQSMCLFTTNIETSLSVTAMFKFFRPRFC